MPTYTVKEISELIKKPSKTVEVYCARKKLIKNSDKKIDTANPINEAFLTKYIVANNTVQSEIPPELLPEKEPTEKKNGKAKDKVENTNGLMSFELDLAIKRLNAEKIQKDIELKDIDIRKKNNEIIDLNGAIKIVSEYSESFKTDIEQSIRNYIQDICSYHGIDSAKTGEYKSGVVDLINISNKKSIEYLLKQLNNE